MENYLNLFEHIPEDEHSDISNKIWEALDRAGIELTSQLLRDHIEELMKGDWEKVRDEVALCHGALYELHGQRIN